MTKSIESLRKFMDGQKIIVCTWTSSRRSTSPTAHLGTSGTGTITPSYWYPTMTSKLDRCEGEKISVGSTTHNLTVLQREQGRRNAHTPKNERARQTLFNEALRAEIANFLFINFTTMVTTRTPRLSMARSTLVERVMTADSFKVIDFFHRLRAQTLANVVHVTGVKTEHLLARTFFCVAHLITNHHTHLRVTQVWNVWHLCASYKSSTHNMFHRPLVLDPFLSFCSTSPPTSPHGGCQFGRLVEPALLTLSNNVRQTTGLPTVCPTP